MTGADRLMIGASVEGSAVTGGPVQPGGEVILYEAPDGQLRLDVRLDRETVWLPLDGMAALFGRHKSVISRHLRAVYASGELDRGATVANMQQFREHLLRGYTLNERRLRETGLGEAEQTLALLARTLATHERVSEEGRAVLDVVQRYTRSWRLLFEYDKRRLPASPARPRAPAATLSVEDVRAVIASLRKELGARGEASPPGHEPDRGRPRMSRFGECFNRGAQRVE